MPKAQHSAAYRPALALLREMRKTAGLTQRALAKKIKWDHVRVHKSETGSRRVDIAEFLIWCRGCGVEPEQAFRRFIRGGR